MTAEHQCKRCGFLFCDVSSTPPPCPRCKQAELEAEVERLKDVVSFYEDLADDEKSADWPHGDVRHRGHLRKRLAEVKQLRESEETAWGIIANAHGGDWDLASEASGWKDAAVKWRDNYHAHLPSPKEGAEAVEEA